MTVNFENEEFLEDYEHCIREIKREHSIKSDVFIIGLSDEEENWIKIAKKNEEKQDKE